MKRSFASSLIVAAFGLWLTTSPSGAAEGLSYRAGVGDLLNVVVYGDDKLSGRFRVGPGGTISYPLLGEIAVADLTPREIGQRLADALAERIPGGGAPSVEIAEFAPVFVLGNVDKPGPYQFRPGMIALELVALGGGERRPPNGQSGMLQLIAAEQELADLRIQRFSEEAKKARILAEIAGHDFSAQTPIGNGDLLPAATRRQILDNEAALFEVRKRILADQEKALGAQHASYDQEIASLNESIVLHDEEVRLLEQEVATQETLVQKGLAVQPRLLALKRELSATRRNALELRSYLARARQRQLEVEQKLGELKDERIRDNATVRAELDISTVRTDEKIAATIASMNELRSLLNSAREAGRRATVYTVTRLENGRYVTTTVGELDPLQPRDILRIEVPGVATTAAAAPLRAAAAGPVAGASQPSAELP
ncbi:polysaccharide biosynthesis/export family protein [Chelatococcus sp. GCM10030263]|uniref:polysaccharide biosynthesis/export family protein n=1 Tax=Chelatococcus sp. GCM10030263 TaxID=3273387 RepID=UPI003620EF99